MERVFICSPFRGAEEKNVELARKYARFAYEKGCLPVVPHLYFPQFLKESDVQERMAGIQFGLSLLKECREQTLIKQVRTPEKVLSLLWKKQKAKVRAFGDF